MESDIVLTFELERSTKNTYRYAEKESNAHEPLKIGTIYLQKWVFGANDAPKVLEVTITSK